jgi:hypothetical protein
VFALIVLGIVGPVASDQWLDVYGAARYLGLTPKLIYRHIDDGRLHVLRFPVRIHRTELDRVLSAAGSNPERLHTLTPTRDKRAETNTAVPATRAGTPDRRYGRRYPPPNKWEGWNGIA